MTADVREVVRRFGRDDGLGVAAELAYRAFLAFVPFLIFVVTLAAFARDALALPDPTDQLIRSVGDSLPANVVGPVRDELGQLFNGRHPELLSAGLVFALLAATGGTNALIKAMDRAYEVPETRPFWRRYLTALAITVLAGAALVAALALSIAARVFGQAVAPSVGLANEVERIVGIVSVLLTGLLLFASAVLVYRFAPNIRVPFSCVWPGAAVFVLSLLGTTAVFSFYVGAIADYGATYGTLASVVVFLTWLYLTAALLMLGAEVNVIVADRRHGRLVDTARERARMKPPAAA